MKNKISKLMLSATLAITFLALPIAQINYSNSSNEFSIMKKAGDPKYFEVTNITDTSATFSWENKHEEDANKLTGGAIHNGSEILASLTVGEINNETYTATNLIPETEYSSYVITIFYGTNTIKTSNEDVTFTTLSTPEIPATSPSNFSTSNITENSVMFSWDINDLGTWIITGGIIKSDALESPEKVLTDVEVVGESIIWSGLDSNSNYNNYYLEITYDSGSTLVTNTVSFMTLDLEAENPTNFEVSNITQTTAEFSWDLNQQNDWVVVSGLITNGIDDLVILSANEVTSGVPYEYDSLTSNTQYDNYYLEITYDEGFRTTNNVSFSTAKVSATNPIMGPVTNISETRATLSWQNNNNDWTPTGGAVYGNNGGSFTIILKTLSIQEIINETVLLVNLSSNTDYTDVYVSINYSEDQGNSYDTNVTSFKTLDTYTVAEAPSNFNYTLNNQNSVTFEWDSNHYDSTPESARITSDSNQGHDFEINLMISDIMNEEVTINNLQSGTTYNDYYIEIDYGTNDGLQQSIPIASFTTDQNPAESILSFEVEETTELTATFSWVLGNPNDWVVESIEILDDNDQVKGSLSVEDIEEGIINTMTISSLETNKLYEDWYLSVGYDSNVTLISDTVSFTTDKTVAASPTLFSTTNPTTDSIDFNWVTTNNDWTVESGTITNGTNVLANLTSEEVNADTYFLDNLSTGTAYTGYYLEINYLDSATNLESNTTDFETQFLDAEAPTNFETSDIFVDSVTVTWNNNHGNTELIGGRITDGVRFINLTLDDINSETYTHGFLSPNTSYDDIYLELFYEEGITLESNRTSFNTVNYIDSSISAAMIQDPNNEDRLAVGITHVNIDLLQTHLVVYDSENNELEKIFLTQVPQKVIISNNGSGSTPSIASTQEDIRNQLYFSQVIFETPLSEISSINLVSYDYDGIVASTEPSVDVTLSNPFQLPIEIGTSNDINLKTALPLGTIIGIAVASILFIYGLVMTIMYWISKDKETNPKL